MFQSRRVLIWHEKELLNDGFFSFAAVRQMFVMLSKIILLATRSQALKTQNR